MNIAIDDLIIDEGTPLMEAMKRLDATGQRIVFLAPGGKLQAVLTDSDVRRFLLRGGDLSAPVREAANYKPKTLPVERRAEAKAFLQSNHIDSIPLLNKDGAIVDLVFVGSRDEVRARQVLRTPVVIMAGGQGTRLYPYTKILPKPLIPVGDVPILELLIERFHDYGCRDFTLIVNYKKNMIKSYFADEPRDYDVRFVDEETPLGTGGGLCLLKGRVNETFFFTNCDILIDADYADLLRAHKASGNAITIVCAAKQFTIPYGVIETDNEGRYVRQLEKPEMNYLTNTGMYVVEPDVIDHVEDGVNQGFPDIIEQCRARGGRIGVYPVSEASWMDMGQLEELDEMRRRLETGS